MTKEEVRKTVQKELFVLQDLKYRDFHAKLIPWYLFFYAAKQHTISSLLVRYQRLSS